MKETQGLLEESTVELAKLTGAWMPIDKQRERFGNFQAKQNEKQEVNQKPEQSLNIYKRTYKGLANIGNTCYMASFL
jgi:uncharacterized UBP type Zn finger protein